MTIFTIKQAIRKKDVTRLAVAEFANAGQNLREHPKCAKTLIAPIP
ncbi:hypothetical protein [Nostoc sp.]